MKNLGPKRKGKSPLTVENQIILIALGQAVAETRKKLTDKQGYAMSQEAFAEEAGVHRTFAGAVERGERNLSLLNLMKICKALKTTPSSLLKKAGY